MNPGYIQYIEKLESPIFADVELDDFLLSICSKLDQFKIIEVIAETVSLDEIYEQTSDYLKYLCRYKYANAVLGDPHIIQEDVTCGARALKTAKYLLDQGIRKADLTSVVKGVFIYHNMP